MRAPLTYYRHINLANATFDELEQLTQACEPTYFDVIKKAKTKKVKMNGPGKMDSGSFSPLLVPVQTNLMKIIRDYHFEGDKSRQTLKIELRELNVYSTHFHSSLSTFEAQQTLRSLTHVGKGSFSKLCAEALPNKNMLGSLVIIFPTPHEGGVMSLKSRAGHKRSFDPSPETSEPDITHIPSIGYVVLFKDVEHEVAPITSGHRVTLTYDLYAEDDASDRPIPTEEQQVSESISLLANQPAFHDAFAALLENREFLAEGGMLAFGLMHNYSIRNDFNPVYGALKGSDAAVYRTLRALGFDPVLRMYYHKWEPGWISESLHGHAVVFDKIMDFSSGNWEESDVGLEIPEFVSWRSGHIVFAEDQGTDEEYGKFAGAEEVSWVTPVTTFNRKESTFASSNGMRAVTNVAYGDLCLFVRIGRAGERLSYPRVAQSENASEDDSGSGSESQGSED